jgi:hypothetical protein
MHPHRSEWSCGPAIFSGAGISVSPTIASTCIRVPGPSLFPLKSQVGKRLLGGVRSWIEAAQSYEKNQLGLNQLFLNSLRLCWIISLLADTVCLLRACAFLGQPLLRPLLFRLLPNQLPLELDLD